MAEPRSSTFLWSGGIEVLRGGHVEARHAVHAVVSDADGRVAASVGDPDTSTFYRSAAKPLQALPLVEDGVVQRLGLSTSELAVCCASHEGEPQHLAATRAILAKAGLGEEALACGPHLPFSEKEAHAVLRDGGRALRVHNNCSGKHAGMLALAASHGWDPDGYHRPGHPVQARMLREIARWSGVAEREVGTAVDGCGVPCFSVPLRAMAASFARFAAATARGEAPARIVAAMTGHPFMVGGTGRACTAVMERARGRVFVKVGAEGVYGAGVPERGLGVAIKVADGARRAAEVALIRVLRLVGALDDADVQSLTGWARPDVRNTRGDVVGRIQATFGLSWT